MTALIRLGEQAKRLGNDFISQNPGPQYQLMVDQRNALAHRYRSVDWDLVWGSLTIDVPRDSVSHRHVQEASLRTARRLAASRRED